MPILRVGFLGMIATAMVIAADYPTFDPSAADAEPILPVFLPADARLARQLVHRWNAISVVADPPPVGKAGWRVPLLAEVFGADGMDGRDRDPEPRVQGWAMPWRPFYERQAAPDAHRLRFGFLRSADVLILPVPGEEYRQRLQRFVDEQVLADGAAYPPRMGRTPVVSSGERSQVFESLWLIVVAGAVGGLVGAACCMLVRCWRRSVGPPPA